MMWATAVGDTRKRRAIDACDSPFFFIAAWMSAECIIHREKCKSEIIMWHNRATCQENMARMDTIGDRIRAVRESLKMSQTAFAEMAGVKKRAQVYYEAGTRQPDLGYLLTAMAAGIDIQYLLTGVHMDDYALERFTLAAKITIDTTTDPDQKISLARALFSGVPDQARMTITDQEVAHIVNLRRCSETDRAVIEKMAQTLASDSERPLKNGASKKTLKGK